MYPSIHKAAAVNETSSCVEERWAKWGVVITIACVVGALAIIAGSSPWAATALQVLARSAGK